MEERGRRFDPAHVTFQRIYKDGDDGWKTSQSFGRDDLLVLAKVADLARSRIHELRLEPDGA